MREVAHDLSEVIAAERQRSNARGQSRHGAGLDSFSDNDTIARDAHAATSVVPARNRSSTKSRTRVAESYARCACSMVNAGKSPG